MLNLLKSKFKFGALSSESDGAALFEAMDERVGVVFTLPNVLLLFFGLVLPFLTLALRLGDKCTLGALRMALSMVSAGISISSSARVDKRVSNIIRTMSLLLARASGVLSLINVFSFTLRVSISR